MGGQNSQPPSIHVLATGSQISHSSQCTLLPVFFQPADNWLFTVTAPSRRGQALSSSTVLNSRSHVVLKNSPARTHCKHREVGKPRRATRLWPGSQVPAQNRVSPRLMPSSWNGTAFASLLSHSDTSVFPDDRSVTFKAPTFKDLSSPTRTLPQNVLCLSYQMCIVNLITFHLYEHVFFYNIEMPS